MLKKTKAGSRTQNVGCVFSCVLSRVMICVLKATIPQRPAERCVQFSISHIRGGSGVVRGSPACQDSQLLIFMVRLQQINQSPSQWEPYAFTALKVQLLFKVWTAYCSSDIKDLRSVPWAPRQHTAGMHCSQLSLRWDGRHLRGGHALYFLEDPGDSILTGGIEP